MYLSGMSTKFLVKVLLGIVAVAVIAGCSSATPTPVPSPTPTLALPPRITLEEAGAFMRAVVVREPGCASVDLQGASFAPTWEPATKSWLVHVTTSSGLEGDYRIFEELGFTVDAVNQMIPGEC